MKAGKITIKMDRKLAECEGEEGGTEIQPVCWFRRLDTASQLHQFLTLPFSFSTIHFTYQSLENIWVCSYLSKFSILSGLVVKSPLVIAGGAGDTCSWDRISLGRKDPLEEGMATHSSILAWKVPWIEEPGWLQEAHRVAKSWTQ